eukprot:3992496-Prymnesium_polylepis.1
MADVSALSSSLSSSSTSSSVQRTASHSLPHCLRWGELHVGRAAVADNDKPTAPPPLLTPPATPAPPRGLTLAAATIFFVWR